jgi:hypothetical protein
MYKIKEKTEDIDWTDGPKRSVGVGIDKYRYNQNRISNKNFE